MILIENKSLVYTVDRSLNLSGSLSEPIEKIIQYYQDYLGSRKVSFSFVDLFFRSRQISSDYQKYPIIKDIGNSLVEFEIPFSQLERIDLYTLLEHDSPLKDIEMVDNKLCIRYKI